MAGAGRSGSGRAVRMVGAGRRGRGPPAAHAHTRLRPLCVPVDGAQIGDDALAPVVALDGLLCEGPDVANCPRGEYLYCRESWLRRTAASADRLDAHRA